MSGGKMRKGWCKRSEEGRKERERIEFLGGLYSLRAVFTTFDNGCAQQTYMYTPPF